MKSTLMSSKASLISLLVLLAACLVASQQIPRPGGGSSVVVSPSSAPTPAQAVAAAQYYASAVSQSPPKPIPPPQQQPSQQQLQQQYLLQQQRERERERERQKQATAAAAQQHQQRQQPQVIYQPKVVQGPPKSNQLRVQQQQGPSRGQQTHQSIRQQQQQQGNSQEGSFESYEEEEEPDRLTQLLLNSKFQCTNKKDGYYADESLACEVFHYCHDSVKHSWMCPNQFMFHQVHLICVPPSSENICKQSSNFHFVNEYLYRPINVKEVERNQNVSLRYGDRYYPEGYAVGLTPFDDQYLLGESHARVTVAPTPSSRDSHHPHQQQQQPQHVRGKVYFSADSVNIPLSQRRPTIAAPASSRQPALHSDEEYDYE